MVIHIQDMIPQKTCVLSAMKTNPRLLLGMLLINGPFWAPAMSTHHCKGPNGAWPQEFFIGLESRPQDAHLSIKSVRKALSIF